MCSTYRHTPKTVRIYSYTFGLSKKLHYICVPRLGCLNESSVASLRKYGYRYTHINTHICMCLCASVYAHLSVYMQPGLYLNESVFHSHTFVLKEHTNAKINTVSFDRFTIGAMYERVRVHMHTYETNYHYTNSKSMLAWWRRTYRRIFCIGILIIF